MVLLFFLHGYIEFQKHKWKSGRARNAVGTWAVMGECFHIFFEFSQTFSIKQLDYELFICFMI